MPWRHFAGKYLQTMRLRIPPLLFVLAAAALLLVPLKWIGAILLCTVIHELWHLAALSLLGVRIQGISVGVSGVKIFTESMTDAQELICALAGPVGSMSLLFFARWLPLTAVCAAVQGIYNLIPVYPSDGGRILRCISGLVLPHYAAAKLCGLIELGMLVSIVALGVYCSVVLRLGLLPLAASIVLLAKNSKKNPLQTDPTRSTIVLPKK